MNRPQASVFIAVSLDGYIARTDGRVDWLDPFQVPGEDYGYAAFMATVDTLVMGRKTYDTVLGFGIPWPFAGKRCIVLTSRPAVAKNGEEFYAGDVTALVERLGREGCRRLYVDGGFVIREFLEAGLVDDLTLSIVPIVLGAGIRLFAGGEPERRLVTDETRTWPSGLVQLRYRFGV